MVICHTQFSFSGPLSRKRVQKKQDRYPFGKTALFTFESIKIRTLLSVLLDHTKFAQHFHAVFSALDIKILLKFGVNLTRFG